MIIYPYVSYYSHKALKKQEEFKKNNKNIKLHIIIICVIMFWQKESTIYEFKVCETSVSSD